MPISRRASIQVHGNVDPGFEPVRYAFEQNLAERGELGAAFAVQHRGRLVVDLWGGHLDKARRTPWSEDTVTTVFSTTKGISSLAMALAHSRELFDWDDPVARHWPEFAQAGKAEVTIRQLVGHQSPSLPREPARRNPDRSPVGRDRPLAPWREDAPPSPCAGNPHPGAARRS